MIASPVETGPKTDLKGKSARIGSRKVLTDVRNDRPTGWYVSIFCREKRERQLCGALATGEVEKYDIYTSLVHVDASILCKLNENAKLVLDVFAY